MQKGKIRDQILEYVHAEGYNTWTVETLTPLRIDPTKVGNAHYNMKIAGLIVDTGHKDGNKTIWRLPTSPLVEQEPEVASYHSIGEQIVDIMRQQDAQIASDTKTIKQLTQMIADLQTKNNELSEKLNRVSKGRITTRELSDMNKRSSLQ